MGGSHRRGRFRAVGQINAVAVMGGDEIDLRQAEIEGGELTVNLISFMGGSNVYVPDSVDVEVGGFSFMGGHEEIGREPAPRPGGPGDPDPGVEPDGRRVDLPSSAAGPRRRAAGSAGAWPGPLSAGQLPAPG